MEIGRLGDYAQREAKAREMGPPRVAHICVTAAASDVCVNVLNIPIHTPWTASLISYVGQSSCRKSEQSKTSPDVSLLCLLGDLMRAFSVSKKGGEDTDRS